MPYDNSDDPDGPRVKVSEETIEQAEKLFKLEYPLDKQIIDRCNVEIETNRHKRNSWRDQPFKEVMPILLMKLQEEYSEFVIAIKNDPSMIEKEGADAINVISMIMRRYRQWLAELNSQ